MDNTEEAKEADTELAAQITKLVSTEREARRNYVKIVNMLSEPARSELRRIEEKFGPVVWERQRTENAVRHWKSELILLAKTKKRKFGETLAVAIPFALLGYFKIWSHSASVWILAFWASVTIVQHIYVWNWLMMGLATDERDDQKARFQASNLKLPLSSEAIEAITYHFELSPISATKFNYDEQARLEEIHFLEMRFQFLKTRWNLEKAYEIAKFDVSNFFYQDEIFDYLNFEKVSALRMDWRPDKP